MKIPHPLANARSEHVREGQYWLGFTLFGGLLPVYGGALFLWIFSSKWTPTQFVDHGEFAIYTAGLLASALFIVVREYQGPFPERAGWGLFTGVLLVLSVLVFAAAAAADADPKVADHLNKVPLRVVSLAFYVMSVVATYILTIRSQGLELDYQAVRGDTMAKLDKKFDELEN